MSDGMMCETCVILLFLNANLIPPFGIPGQPTVTVPVTGGEQYN